MSAILSIVHYTEKGNTVPLSSPSADALINIWQECTGFQVLPYHRRYFTQWLEDGFEDCLISVVIEETMNAPRPSFTYLQSIMAALRREQVHTLDQYIERQAAFHARRRS